MEDGVRHLLPTMLQADCLCMVVAVEPRAEVYKPTLARPRSNVRRFRLDLRKSYK